MNLITLGNKYSLELRVLKLYGLFKFLAFSFLIVPAVRDIPTFRNVRGHGSTTVRLQSHICMTTTRSGRGHNIPKYDETQAQWPIATCIEAPGLVHGTLPILLRHV